MLSRILREYKTLEKGVACQAVLSVDSVAAGLTRRIEVIHRSVRIQIHVDAAHEVMLRRNDRYILLRRVDAALETVLDNMWETLSDIKLRDRRHIEMDVLRVILLHLLQDLCAQEVSWKQLIREALTVLVSKDCSLASD